MLYVIMGLLVFVILQLANMQKFFAPAITLEDVEQETKAAHDFIYGSSGHLWDSRLVELFLISFALMAGLGLVSYFYEKIVGSRYN